ncbi:uncharacterized protein LOC143853798 [Tasmannia lanceolata]|uniref:uncharacterized protein LOC143853798 n=1 Tax=Tasmannia lanceolata TaxID=3420 RepID=UPI0040641517
MVFSSALPQGPSHIRSISMPSRSHPLVSKVEEEITKLKTWVNLSASGRTTLKADKICIGLGGLKDLYCCIEDLLQLPLTQQVLIHHEQEKWAEKVLDGSLRLLDLCGTTRDLLLHMKECVKDLQLAIRRRRGGDSSIKSKVDAYIFSRKKAKKEIGKHIELLKRMDKKYVSSTLLDQDQHFATVVRVLIEVKVITISIFKSMLFFMSASRPNRKQSKWSVVSKLMNKAKVSCEERQEDKSEVENVDVALFLLSRRISSKDGEMEMVKNAQKRLKDLEVRVEGLEAGLECMFRHLIQTRVSFLNILSH